MEVLVILVPLALGLGLVGLLGFLWSLKSGQYDDLEGAAWRAIADDDPAVMAIAAVLSCSLPSRSLPCWNICAATPDVSSRAAWFSTMSGSCASIRRRTSSMSTSTGCGIKSTAILTGL